MKKIIRPAIVIGIGLTLALFSAALTFSVQSSSTNNTTSAAFLFQTTSTSEPVNQSEVGSTDGIAVMGGVIALIAIIPILIRRKHWMQPTR